MSFNELIASGLSICLSVRSGAKHVVGTQLGVLSVFERQKGWQDSVDRILGYVRASNLARSCDSVSYNATSLCYRHPASVEAMVALTDDIVATGSEDGMIRVMQVHPNKFRKWLHSSCTTQDL